MGFKLTQLSQGVRIVTSNGYKINSQDVIADYTKSEVSTLGQVFATGPLGELTAGQMILRQQTGDGLPNTYELVFKNGVKVI